MIKYRQGDVYVAVVDEIPKTAKKVDNGKDHYVVAYGERTGHAHVLMKGKQDSWEIYKNNDEIYVKHNEPLELKHGLWVNGAIEKIQHKPHTITEKIVKIWRQVEHLPNGFIEKVQD